MDKKRIPVVAIVAVAVCVVGCASALFMGRTDSPGSNVDFSEKVFDLIYDESSTAGGWEQKSEEEIQAELNSKVEEGMINMSMNTSPYFVNGESAGNLMIVNESINRYPQVVQIYRNDTGELIYTSNMIAVGSKIEADTLDVVLSSGVYKCTAMFHSVNPETGAVTGSAGMVIELTVKD